VVECRVKTKKKLGRKGGEKKKRDKKGGENLCPQISRKSLENPSRRLKNGKATLGRRKLTPTFGVDSERESTGKNPGSDSTKEIAFLKRKGKKEITKSTRRGGKVDLTKKGQGYAKKRRCEKDKSDKQGEKCFHRPGKTARTYHNRNAWTTTGPPENGREAARKKSGNGGGRGDTERLCSKARGSTSYTP